MTLGIHALADRVRSQDEMYAAIKDSGGRYHVILNNPGLAARVVLLPNATVIYRRWRNDHGNPGEDNAQDHYNAVDFVRRLDDEAPTGAMLNLGNEPWMSTPAHWQKIGDWTFAAMEEAERRNRRCAIFNASTWNPPAEAWKHPSIRKCLDRAVSGNHVLGLHMYYGVDGNKDPFGPKNFPENIGRWQDVRAVVPNIAIVATETGYCHEFKPHVGYVGKMSDDEYADDLERIAKHWAEAGIHGCIFAIGSESDDWGSFSLRRRVIERIAAYNATEQIGAPPMPEPQPTPPSEPTPIVTPTDKGAGIAGTLYTGDYVNLRPAPATTAVPPVEIPNGAGIVWYPATERTNGGWTWVYVETGNRAGWMARVWPSWSTQFAPITPDVPLKPSVLLDIPWVSQLGDDAPDANDCGPAAATSAIRAAGLRLNRDDLKAVTPKAFNNHLGSKQTGADVNDMVTALGRYGITARALRATTANIKRQLSAGHYPIVVIERGAIPLLRQYNVFAQAHWVGVRGYAANGFTLVDPLVTNGRDLRVTEAELATALSGSTWNGVRQSGYIGITVELPPLPVVIVPTPADPPPVVVIPPPINSTESLLKEIGLAAVEARRRREVWAAAQSDMLDADEHLRTLTAQYIALSQETLINSGEAA